MKTKTFVLDNLTHEEAEIKIDHIYGMMNNKKYIYESHVVYNSNIPGKFKIVAKGRKWEK